MKNEKLKKESVTTEFDALTDEQLEQVLGGLAGNASGTEIPVSANAQSAVVITAKTAGVANQITGFNISV